MPIQAPDGNPDNATRICEAARLNVSVLPVARSPRNSAPALVKSLGALVHVFVVAMLTLSWLNSAAAQSLEIIELRSRPAEQILPLLQPLLTNGGSISGSGFQLFVRTGAANLAQIRQVVASLDRAARQVMISVRQEFGAATSVGGVGGQIVLHPGTSSGRGSLYDRTSTARDDVAQQVRTHEGIQAWIQTGSSMVTTQRSVTRTVNGVIVRETPVQRDFNTGFYVTPRMTGDTVYLDIATQRDTPDATGVRSGTRIDAVSTSRVSSTVSGKLGAWIDLGGSSHAQASEERGILSRSSDAGSQERALKSAGAARLDGAQELYLFGWSAKHGEMVAVSFTKAANRTEFAIDDEVADLAIDGAVTGKHHCSMPPAQPKVKLC